MRFNQGHQELLEAVTVFSLKGLIIFVKTDCGPLIANTHQQAAAVMIGETGDRLGDGDLQRLVDPLLPEIPPRCGLEFYPVSLSCRD
jgi:hypothetical protein